MYALITFFSIIGFDQLIKYLVRSQNYFYIINKGAAFSLGSQWWWFEWAVWIIFFGILYLTYQTFWIKKQKKIEVNTFSTIVWSLFLAGAFSNIIDRFFLNGVVDYIVIRSLGNRLPVFNLADISINFAIILWVWNWWRVRKD